MRRGFSLIELLVVVGILAVLMAILLPSLGAAKRTAQRTKCLANMRNLELAQQIYAAYQGDSLIPASDGSFSQGSWINLLQPYSGAPLIRRCPADGSPFFDTPMVVGSVTVARTSSYAINNYVSPTHFPTGMQPYTKLGQVPRPFAVIHLVELVETGNNAIADHVHADEFYSSMSSILTMAKISAEMPVGQHDGKIGQWSAVLNYSFLDGHAECLPLRDVYQDLNHNKFNPSVAP